MLATVRTGVASKLAPTALALAGLAGFVSCSTRSTAVSLNGADVYARKCASCHGKAGEGVEGKYADALYGDWPVPKLAHYIAQNMPEDDPETLSPAEAGAVASYIHDAFYSRAAQARLHPARVELAHLSNRQYAITIAELLRGFGGGDDAPLTPDRGLHATYYTAAQRGRFDAAKVARTGIDPTIDFALGPENPLYAALGITDFSAQWRGSVLAEETGDYEFVVRTPNSIRVWINADVNPGAPAEAVIDANVSRPDDPDHRVTVRLLGGRRYPIGIDYWALPGKAGAPPPSIVLRWKPPHGSERPIPARNLSPVRVKPTFVLTTRFPPDDSSQGYERSTTVSKAWDEATTSAALEVANQVVRKLDALADTRSDEAARGEKVAAFAERLVTAAFRRPLSEEEKRLYVTERFRGAVDSETAIKRVVLLALKSPQFLYPEVPGVAAASRRSDLEESAAGRRSHAFTTASRLSFALWDAPPDAELMAVAAAGRLQTRAEVAAQATRMLADPRARAKLHEFFQHWLQLRFVEDLRKDPALYPDFTPELIDDLRTSLRLFVDEVVWADASDFRELLRANYLVANDRVAGFYGLPAPASGEFARVPAPADQRAGVLTHPYLLAAFSYKHTSSPIHRGVFLTRNIVGRALKSPPMAQAFDETGFTPDMTMREKVAKLTRSESCQGCHAVINPLGFSLEWYDAVGRFRQEENGRPIDAVSDYLTDDNRKVRLAGARDVAEFAITSEQANHAFIEQLFHHVVQQPIRAYGAQTPDALRDSFIASGYNLQKLLVEIATLGALRDTNTPTPQLTLAR